MWGEGEGEDVKVGEKRRIAGDGEGVEAPDEGCMRRSVSMKPPDWPEEPDEGMGESEGGRSVLLGKRMLFGGRKALGERMAFGEGERCIAGEGRGEGEGERGVARLGGRCDCGEGERPEEQAEAERLALSRRSSMPSCVDKMR